MAFLRNLSKKYIAEFVYGATDGTVTTFAIVSGVVGASLSPSIVLILGISNVLADGFSMASSKFLSARSESAIGRISHSSPIIQSVMTFVSFIGVGIIPLLPFLYALFRPAVSHPYLVSIIFTAIAFMGIGYVRGEAEGGNRVKNAVETLVIGGVAASIAFFVGYALKDIGGAL